MNALKLFFFLFCCFISYGLSAQTPKDIEIDLYRSFQKIDNWQDRQDTLSNRDSLENANNDFAQRLKKYTTEYPFTIDQKFTELVKDHLDIASSVDGLFRIYSWDTWLGGSKHAFENLFQFKANNSTISDLKKADASMEGHPTYWFSNLYTLKVNDKTYYLAVFNGVYSAKDAGQGIQVFTIENGKLIDDIKLIKNTSGLHNQLYYDYDLLSVVHLKVRPSVYFDDASNSIFVPLVDGDGKVTNKYITYKFTGQYFEKVKN